MADETGMFSKISDESINAGKGKTYTSSRMMADPMAGLDFSEEPSEEADKEERM